MADAPALPLLDRLIGYWSPIRGAERARARAHLSVFNNYGAFKGGAGLARNPMAGWWPRRGDPDELVTRDLDTLRRRSADLTRNNAIASGAIRTKVRGVVGTGLKVHASIDRDYLGLAEDEADAWEDRATALFTLWAESADCHVRRRYTFAEQQAIAERAVLVDGDCFIQLTNATRSELPFRLALQHIAAARVCNPQGEPETSTLVRGVEMDANGAPIAYHVANRHPEAARTGPLLTWQRLPAFDPETGRRRVLHLHTPLADDLTRGVPELAPVMETIKQLDRFTDAEVDAAVKSALFAFLVKSQTGEGLAGFQTVDDWDAARRDYYRDKPMAVDGSAKVLGLFPDDEVLPWESGRPNAGYDPFMQAMTRQLGPALGLPQEVLNQAFLSSYSASRAALMQAASEFAIARIRVANQLCKVVWGAFIDELVAFGWLAAPGYFADPLIRAAYVGARWVGDAPMQLDEGAAVKAAAERVALGVSTLADETVGLTGRDWEQVRRQRDKEIRRGGVLPPAVTGQTSAPAPDKPKPADQSPDQTPDPTRTPQEPTDAP